MANVRLVFLMKLAQNIRDLNIIILTLINAVV